MFRAVALDGEERDFNVCCYAPSLISEDETIWLNKVEPDNALEDAWSTLGAESASSEPEGIANHIWRISGYAGFVNNPDGYMHELIFMEYDSTAHAGIALVAFEEETVKAHPELFDNAPLKPAPCPDKELVEVAMKWSIAPFLFKARVVEYYRASQRKS